MEDGIVKMYYRMVLPTESSRNENVHKHYVVLTTLNIERFGQLLSENHCVTTFSGHGERKKQNVVITPSRV